MRRDSKRNKRFLDDKIEAAFEDCELIPLLEHDIADIQRTRELEALAGQFVARSNFRIKDIEPPRQT